MAIVVADGLGLKIEDVTVTMGDSNLPPAPGAGGSNNAASTSNVAAKACDEVRGKLALAAVRANDGPFAGAAPATLKLARGPLVRPRRPTRPHPNAHRRS